MKPIQEHCTCINVNACTKCNGSGFVGFERLENLRIGTRFEDCWGNVLYLVRKEPNGVMHIKFPDGSENIKCGCSAARPF